MAKLIFNIRCDQVLELQFSYRFSNVALPAVPAAGTVKSQWLRLSFLVSCFSGSLPVWRQWLWQGSGASSVGSIDVGRLLCWLKTRPRNTSCLGPTAFLCMCVLINFRLQQFSSSSFFWEDMQYSRWLFAYFSNFIIYISTLWYFLCKIGANINICKYFWLQIFMLGPQ